MNNSIATNASIESHSRKNIILGTIFGYIALALSVVSGLVFTPWLINELGSSDYALYTLSNSIITFFAADIGISTAVNSFISNYRAKGDKEGETAAMAAFNRIALAIDVILFVIFAILYFCVELIYQGLTPDEIASLKNVYIILAAYSLISFAGIGLNGVVSAYEEFVFAKLLDMCSRLLYIAFTIIAIYSGFGLYGLVAANSISNLLILITKYVYIKSRLKVKGDPFGEVDKQLTIKILKFMAWSAVLSVSYRFVFTITPSILGIVSDSTNITYFSLVSSIEGYIYTFGAVMSGLFLPKINRMMEGENFKENIERLAIKIGKIQLSIVSLVIIGFACVGQEFILWWMDGETEYIVSYYGIILVTIYQIISIPEVIFNNAMYSTHTGIKHLAYSSIAKAIVNLGLSFLFSWLWGVMGACLSICIARFVDLAILNYYYRKDLNINLKRFFYETYTRFIPAFIASLVVGLLIHFFFGHSYLTRLLVGAVAITFVYVLTLLPCLTKIDKIQIDRMLQKIKKSPRTIKLKKILPIVSVTALTIGCLTGLLLLTVNEDLSIAGTYVFSYSPSEGEEPQKIEEYKISINNELTIITYSYDADGKETSSVSRYKWQLKVSITNYNQYKDYLNNVSTSTFCVTTQNWGTIWSLFYLNDCLYTMSVYEEYGGEQKCYVKI